MNPIDYLRLGVEQYLRELPDDELDDLMQRVRPPDTAQEPAGSASAAFARKLFGVAAINVVDRVKAGLDPDEMRRQRQEQIARANAERRQFLYGQLFRNVATDRDVAGLRTESQASDMFGRAVSTADNRRQVQILRVAVDNRWAPVVQAFIKHWGGEHPIADTVAELWTLTIATDRAAV